MITVGERIASESVLFSLDLGLRHFAVDAATTTASSALLRHENLAQEQCGTCDDEGDKNCIQNIHTSRALRGVIR